MLIIDDYSGNSIAKELKNNSNSILIHEHDFESIKIKEGKQKSIICLNVVHCIVKCSVSS
jgi:hypothetical protein